MGSEPLIKHQRYTRPSINCQRKLNKESVFIIEKREILEYWKLEDLTLEEIQFNSSISYHN